MTKLEVFQLDLETELAVWFVCWLVGLIWFGLVWLGWVGWLAGWLAGWLVEDLRFSRKFRM